MVSKNILVIGGTGAMGSRVIKHLSAATDSIWRIKVLTRCSTSEEALALRGQLPNVELIEGSVIDIDRIPDAAFDVDAVFCNTDFWSLWGPNGESLERDISIKLLEKSKHCGIEHFIYSSADHAEALSGWRLNVPHFDSKGAVEQYINQKRYQGDHWFRSSVSVLRTAPYFENFLSFFRPEKDIAGNLTFSLPINSSRWTMVALEDIGWFAAHLLSLPEYWRGLDLAIASDTLELEEIAKTVQKVSGIKTAVNKISDNDFLEHKSGLGSELLAMFEFTRTIGLRRDFLYLKDIHPDLISFETWAKSIDWSSL